MFSADPADAAAVPRIDNFEDYGSTSELLNAYGTDVKNGTLSLDLSTDACEGTAAMNS